jgi:tetratricopeptide (TPR) repeat protein
MRAHLTRSLLVIGMATAAPSAARAQAAPSEQDMRALIYYSVNGQTEAAAAELRRLRALFPDWTPPETPAAAATPAGPDSEEIDAIWRALADNRVGEAQSAIEALRRRYPAWTPPDDMTRLVDLELSQQAFMGAIAAEDIDEASSIARREPALRRCDRVNNVWLLADLQARRDQRDRALDAYRGILNACADHDVAVATLEKAAAIATPAWLRAAFDDVEPRFPDRRDTLGALETRLLAGLGDGAAAPNTTAGASPSAATTTQTPRTRAPTRPSQVRRTASGLPVTGDPRMSRVTRAAADRAWADCLRASSEPRSLDVLYQRSWCLYGLDRPLQALPGFREALEGGLDANATRDAAYGASLAYLSLGATDDAARIAAMHPMSPPHRLEVETAILDQRGVAAYEAGRYVEAIAYFDELERLQGWLRRDLAMLRAYAYGNAGMRDRSRRAFRLLHTGVASERTAEALRNVPRY